MTKNKTKLNECQACGANWDTITESLKEPTWSENFILSMAIILNCSKCKAHFTEAR